MPILREKIVIQYHDIDINDFENEIEYFGGLPRIEFEDWPFQNDTPGTHLLSIRFDKPFDNFIGMAIFFHLDCPASDAYSLVKFRDKSLCEKPPNAMLMPLGRVVRQPMETESLDHSFISAEPIMRSGSYEGDAFLAQLTNDILPFPSEAATFYIDVHHPPFWQI